MPLYEEAAKISLAGLEIYRFGFFAMLGMLAAAAVTGFLCWAKRTRKGTGPLLLLASLLLGGLFSRIGFCLMDLEELGTFFPLKYWIRFTGGGWSMMGLVGGVMLAGWVTAKITRQKAGLILDISACALPAFMALERAGEGGVPDFDFSRRLSGTFLNGSFLTFSDYDGSYLATWKLTAIVAAVLVLVLIWDLTRSRKDGDTCILFLLLFGGCSVLLESLRYDQFLTVHSFVGLQHVLAAVILAIGLLILYFRADRRQKKLGLAGVISIFAAAAIAIGLEFALDRTTFNKLLIYIAYLAVMAVPVTLGILLRSREKKPLA